MNESRLQHYPHCARGNPSHRECLAAFQDWIAHIRTKSLDVSANEKLRCPMLWCRDSFEDDISAVRHAADCSWLRDSWYWCPRCGRPESFFGDGHSPPAIPRTNSKVKRAVSFFKKLGRRRSTRGTDPSPSSSSPKTENSTCLPFGLDQKGEMDGTPTWAEMSSTPEPGELDNHTYGFPAEIDGSQLSPMMELSCPPMNRFELSSPEPWARPVVPPSKLQKTTLELSSPGAMYFNAELPTLQPKDKTLSSASMNNVANESSTGNISGLSPSIPQPFSHHTRYLMTRHRSSTTLAFKDRGLSSAMSNVTADNAISLVGPGAPLSQPTFVPTKTHVQDLRKVVFVINVEFRQRLRPEPDLLARCSVLSIRMLFEMGLGTLYRCFNGILAHEFDEIFALMIVACASAYMSAYAGYSMNDFFQHMLPWQHAISDQNDKTLFLRVLDRLSFQQGFSAAYSPQIRTSDTSSLLSTLKGGRIISSCSRFLDGELAQAILLLIEANAAVQTSSVPVSPKEMTNLRLLSRLKIFKIILKAWSG